MSAPEREVSKIKNTGNTTRDQQIMDSKFQKVKTDEADADEFGPTENWRIWKNVLLIGFAFMIHFTAFWGASNLQSSVNSEAALGTFTLASIYAALILSNLFLPVIVMRWLEAKWTIAFALIFYMPFILAQFYPRFYTMIPAGIAIGFGGGPLWCAKCTYLTVISEAYSKINGIASDIVVTRFFGVFFMFYQLSQVWGNLISSAVLSWEGSDTTPSETLSNISTTASEIMTEIGNLPQLSRSTDQCGANFCPTFSAEEAVPNFTPPSTEKINLISGIYLACMVCAFLIVLFGVDNMSRYSKGRQGSGSGLAGFKLLAVTLKQLGNPYQILILPITMFIGAEQAFVAADYTSAFVSCGWGISNIGFVMICYGVCNGIASIFAGAIVKLTGRSPVVSFALSLHVAILVTMLVWRPHAENQMVYFIISGLWGTCDALWLVQINSLSGILFPGKEEASYSNFRLWESTGSVITYAYSPYLCTNLKIYLLLSLLIVGTLGYTGIEYLQYKKSKAEIYAKGKFELIESSARNGDDNIDNK